MGFFDFLFFNTTKKINKKEFNRALKELPDISPEERAYLDEVFKKELSDGLTASELRQRIEHLRKNYNDNLGSFEVDHVKNKLSEKIDEK